MASDEIWILGATGRSGSAIAARLVAAGASTVLVGRDAARLAAVAPGARTVVAGSVDAMAAAVREQQPAVVVNTVGPFTDTAVPIARACLPTGHYLDLANDVTSALALLGLHDEALAAGRTLVSGAGFGVLATESVVAMLCRDRPTPERVRVDALASVATEEGVVGEALAATVLGVPPEGGRYEGGRLVPARLGGDPAQLRLPDGSDAATSGIPTGELVAAQRASGAPSVLAASGMLPTGRVARAVLPLAIPLLSLGPLRTFARRRLAGVRTAARPRPKEHSWGHAEVRWADGTRREGWLRLGDAQDFTAAAAAAVATRLAGGRGRPGAFTPTGALGPEIAVEAGGEFVLDP